eukprot:CAMPEP_0198325016 /NCGR_PEP_ID=MMETSP1450-20131203/12864_1 /TAXON_ID=753684 ORGANISM="Madagascaria erythrocladiodes, Strain CCMP3234" /NCGR_SAMPLE_ID=MMETSP1450 /ASSEMBLY_ACC=CAM_ASM_001115 /LENGTH=1032 /DNA_ID=CAMNT_0044028859 /DNA_START=59 /DNA_END=3157 /DNA_ORIENTATION=-
MSAARLLGRGLRGVSLLRVAPGASAGRALGTLARPVFASVAVAPSGPARRWAATAAANELFKPLDNFVPRHNGQLHSADRDEMLATVGVDTIDELIDQTVPDAIRNHRTLSVGEAMTESEALANLKKMMSSNALNQNHIGMGYYGTRVPYVILRNILENPGWYTQYTPYQAEIAQGRLESLLNFQTMICDLTGMDVANASLLDEATAAAEAMAMCFSVGRSKRKEFFVSELVHPQTIALIKTRAEGFGIDVKVGDHTSYSPSKNTCGVLVQYPATDGTIVDYDKTIADTHAAGAKIIFAADLLSLSMLKPPGEMGADFVLGSAQRFGVPMGYGGPHAAFFATKDDMKRLMPGRIIGISRDAHGNPALRMALQTREQHIRRDKATSNICTAQALLANMAAMYGVYHGPEGVKAIARRANGFAQVFAAAASQMGYKVNSSLFFDTVRLDFASVGEADAVFKSFADNKINVRRFSESSITIAFDESHSKDSINALLKCMASVGPGNGMTPDVDSLAASVTSGIDGSSFARTSSFMQHAVFNQYHTEHELLRYLHRLQAKDLSLVHSMISLGSCTMKLNSTSEMIPVTWPEICEPHPFTPQEQLPGYQAMFDSLEKDLADITGFHSVSLQPNSGAQGEYTGLMVIKKYHQSRGDDHRDVCIIPKSAHGTNPASAKMCGMTIVPIDSDEKGNIDIAQLRAKAEQHKDRLAAAMVTYPSTHGVFEDSIKEFCDIIHENGGQVYMDGANMNAQVGLCSPGEIGADVCHLNLHKTFCIPHGGGGPGMGPIGVAEQLAPFLPSHDVIPFRGENETSAMGAVSAAPYGSSAILPISWMFIKMMGSQGLKEATEAAILNANYMMKRLESGFPILYRGERGRCAHEFIVDLRPFKASCGVTESDVAKRLQDYGFHSPTMSWPVAGTLMIEPTESETKAELDRFCDAMLMIREEIRAVEEGRIDRNNNPLKNAPHTAKMVMGSEWPHPYSREEGAFPASWVQGSKFWPTTGRIDDVYGDRNLCTCLDVETYAADQEEEQKRAVAA